MVLQSMYLETLNECKKTGPASCKSLEKWRWFKVFPTFWVVHSSRGESANSIRLYEFTHRGRRSSAPTLAKATAFAQPLRIQKTRKIDSKWPGAHLVQSIFGQFTHSSRTVHAQFTHSSRTVHAQFTHSSRTVHAQFTHSSCYFPLCLEIWCSKTTRKLQLLTGDLLTSKPRMKLY